MALETLKGIYKVGGVMVRDINNDIFEVNHFISIDFESSEIVFKIQNGPIKENGVNGCQLDQLIQVALHMIEGLNRKFPCNENSKAIFHLNAALNALEERKRDREKRGVEGYGKK